MKSDRQTHRERKTDGLIVRQTDRQIERYTNSQIETLAREKK